MNELIHAQRAHDPHLESLAVRACLKKRFPNRKAPSLLHAFINRLGFGACDCWYWIGGVSDIGYGVFNSARKNYGVNELMAHRIAWHLWNGPVPPGLKVLHRCDVRACVNPEHLFLGTQADNVADMTAKGRGVTIPLPGERNPMATLTNADVLAMRAEHATGRFTQKKLAQKYGVAVMTVNRAVRRISWSHI